MRIITSFLLTIFLTCSLLMVMSESRAQCHRDYSWTVWHTFKDYQAIGTLSVDKKKIDVTMSTNYPVSLMDSIFNVTSFKGFDGYNTIPNTNLPRITWARQIGVGGETTICFSEPVTNLVLLFSSLGGLRVEEKIYVTLKFSNSYTVMYDGGGTKFIDSYSLVGHEGNAIIMFPGTISCLTIQSDSYEFFTSMTCASSPRLFPISISDSLKGNCSVNLVASGGKSYRWSGGDNINNVQNIARVSEVYSVTATDNNSCWEVERKRVDVPQTVLRSTVSKTICQDETYLGYRASGSYIDTLKTTEGCDSIRTLNLKILEKPVPVLENNYLNCDDQVIRLSPTVTANTVNIAYEWSTGERASQISADKSGIYSVTISNGICSNTTSTSVTIAKRPTILLDKSYLSCEGQTVNLRPIITTLAGNTTYKWSTGSRSLEINTNSSGIFSVTVSDGICSNTTSTSVTIAKPPTLLPDETVCKNEPLAAGGLDSKFTYLWEPTRETTEVIKPSQTGKYTVRVTNEFNCSSTRSFEVTDCVTEVFAPDAFTPNGDQINDNFKLLITHGLPLKLAIYNRWGDAVFADDSGSLQWDGTYKGTDCPSGYYAYKYIYKALSTSQVYEKQGTILLIR